MSKQSRNRRSRLRCHAERVSLERLESRAVLSAVPVGGQFLINEVLSAPEASTAVAIVTETGGDAGRFVAAWQSYGVDGDGYGIVTQVFEKDGSSVAGAPAKVVSGPLLSEPLDCGLGNQIAPTVASDGNGNFVIAWQGENRLTGGYDVYYRTGTLTAEGLSFSAHQILNTVTAGDQTAPTAAMSGTGSFAIAWQTPAANATDGLDVVYRRGSLADGLGAAEVPASGYLAGDQVSPAAAMNKAGELVIAWRGPDATAGGSEGEEAGGIFLRVFRSDGTSLPDDVRVNASKYNDLGVPDVAIDNSGRLAVAWQVEGQQESGSDVYARRMAFDKVSGAVTAASTATFGDGDFRLNETTQGPQRAPTIGIDDAGNVLAAWQTQHQDGFSWAIFGRRYQASGDSFGSEFLVNTGVQLGPQVAPDIAIAGGRAVVAWLGPDVPTGTEEGEGGHPPAVHARFYEGAGTTPDGNEVVLARYTGLEDNAAATATDAAGNFVVAWQSWEAPGDGSDFGIYAKLFQADGRWIDLNENGVDDDAMLVNTFTAGSQSHPAVAMDVAGNFVVAWQSQRQDGSGAGIYARRYDASAKTWADANDVAVNATTLGDQVAPTVAMDGAGNFTVVWQGPDAEGTGIFRRRFAATGVAREGDTQVNVVSSYDQTTPTIGMNTIGESVIAWVSNHNVAVDALDSEKSIFARWYAANGNAIGEKEFLANSYTKDAQESPAVGIAANGNFVLAWQSINQERNQESVGSSWGVYARQFAVSKADGTISSPQSQEFRVNGTTDGPQRFASVGVDDSGRFNVAWQSIRQDGSSWAVRARAFAADATPVGAEQAVNTFTNGPQILPVIAQRGAGDFTVIWSGQGTGRIEGNWGQRYQFIRDDFNRGDFPSLGPDWIIRSGDFEIRNNVAVIESSRALAQLVGVQLVDASIEARITIGGGTTTSAGLIARSSDARRQTHYWGGIQQKGDQYLAVIGRRVGGSWRALATAVLPAGQGVVRFEVLGDSLKLYFNGKLAVSTNDRRIVGPGRVGMEGGVEAALDDFTYAALQRTVARVPFRDLFAYSDGSQLGSVWKEWRGNFTVDRGSVRGRDSVNIATVNASNRIDSRTLALVNVSVPGAHAGVVARVSANGTKMYWGGVVNRGGVLSAEIWKIEGNSIRRLKTVSLSASTAADHLVAFEATGSSLRLSVDGVAVAATTNTRLRFAGGNGMRTSAGTLVSRFELS